MSQDHFTVDDLFISVRDSRLRAFNRLMLAFNYHEYSPKLARLYLRFLNGIDDTAAASLRKMRLRIAAQGVAAVRQEIKYYVNPHDPDIYTEDPFLRKPRTSSQPHLFARNDDHAVQDEHA